MENRSAAFADWKERIDRAVAEGPFAPTWDSLEQYRVPAWYKDAKFGVFIHWGVYAVPAYVGEWYAHFMHKPDRDEFHHHRATYGPHDRFGYKDFIPQFKAERFDPAAWAALFKRAGARFVMPVAEHHDGFAMYDSALSRWTAARMGPRRDVLGDLAAAIRDEGMVFTASSHRAEHWWFFEGGRTFPSDVTDPAYADLYGPAMPKSMQPDDAFLEDWLVRTCELAEKYRPRVVWFDWWIENPAFAPYLRRFAAYYYNRAAAWGEDVAINYKLQAMPPDTAVFDVERGALADIRYPFWQTDTAVQKNSWGYTENQDYRTAKSLVEDLVDIVSKNGALLLNIGPRADGTIPEPEIALLETVGQWLAVNGEAIYGSRPWKRYGEGPTAMTEGSFQENARQPFTARDVRYTRKGDTLYATCFGWPDDGVLRCPMLGRWKAESPLRVARVDLLGGPDAMPFEQVAAELRVTLPSETPRAAVPVHTFRIATDGA